jgi:autophagy-related protein 11
LTIAERELDSVKREVEEERRRREEMENFIGSVRGEEEGVKDRLRAALREATERTKEIEELRAELDNVRNERELIKNLEESHRSKITHLLSSHESTLRSLEEARARGEDLEGQIGTVRLESLELRGALRDLVEEKERVVRTLGVEHERVMRDWRAEADGDRAVLERRLDEVENELDEANSRASRLERESVESRRERDALTGELRRIKDELRDTRDVERVLREDLRQGKSSESGFEMRIEEMERVVAGLVDVGIGFRDVCVRAMGMANAMNAGPFGGGGNKGQNQQQPQQGQNQSQSQTQIQGSPGSPTPFPSTLSRHMASPGTLLPPNVDPPPLDPSDPQAVLEALRLFDHDTFLESISRTSTTIRKWHKQCKEYRERAKGKISFRNFQKGDLALFLPTRNSVSKPWAAFNGVCSSTFA